MALHSCHGSQRRTDSRLQTTKNNKLLNRRIKKKKIANFQNKPSCRYFSLQMTFNHEFVSPHSTLLEKCSNGINATSFSWQCFVVVSRIRCSCFRSIHTEPGLLVTLNLNGQAKVSQLHCCILALAGEEQVLWLEGGKTPATGH